MRQKQQSGNGIFAQKPIIFQSRIDTYMCRPGDECLFSQGSVEVAIDQAILEGEMIAPDETGRPVFLELLRRARKLA
jgi:hypothetical protein